MASVSGEFRADNYIKSGNNETDQERVARLLQEQVDHNVKVAEDAKKALSALAAYPGVLELINFTR